jgi:hypothetical protein
MRSVDLALYADVLASRVADATARLERANGRLRRAVIDVEARKELPAAVLERLERLGALDLAGPAAVRAEVMELAADVHALEQLQAFVERELFAAREEDCVVRD